jgi:putative CocE/NonD family hydrolase
MAAPYDKGFALVVQGGLDPARAVAAGYAVMVQDVRGRYASEGAFEPFVSEAADGAATIAWLAEQPFCDGRVATYGGSYVGATQLLAATQRPPALRAMLPHVTSADYFDGWMTEGGAFQLGLALNWARSLAAGELARRRDAGEDVAELEERLDAEIADPESAYRRLPICDQPVLAELAPYYLRWLEHPARDAYWRERAARERLGGVSVPALHLAGWHDVFLEGGLAAYAAMGGAAQGSEGGVAVQGGTSGAPQRLVIGPWAHAGWGDAVGEVIYGPEASRYALDPTDLHLSYFDSILRAPDPEAPPVRIFVMGADRWRDEEAWPLARARSRALHLRADGALTWAPPEPGEAPREYVHDPADPVPTTGGRTLMPGHEASIALGARDQRAVEERPDVLVYTSPPLERAVEVTGTVRLVLHAASSALDTDWTAKLVDVHPDGRALGVCDGILRARYRDGLDRERLLEPGGPERFDVTVGSTSMVFRRGHRIRLEVASSNFPRFDRNAGTGGVNAHAAAGDLRTARQHVFGDAARPSHLDLPIVEH